MSEHPDLGLPWLVPSQLNPRHVLRSILWASGFAVAFGFEVWEAPHHYRELAGGPLWWGIGGTLAVFLAILALTGRRPIPRAPLAAD